MLPHQELQKLIDRYPANDSDPFVVSLYKLIMFKRGLKKLKRKHNIKE